MSKERRNIELETEKAAQLALFYAWAFSLLPLVHCGPCVQAFVWEGPSGFYTPLDRDEVWDRSSSTKGGICCHSSWCRVRDLQHLSKVGYWHEECPTWWKEFWLWWLWNWTWVQSEEGLGPGLEVVAMVHRCSGICDWYCRSTSWIGRGMVPVIGILRFIWI